MVVNPLKLLQAALVHGTMPTEKDQPSASRVTVECPAPFCSESEVAELHQVAVECRKKRLKGFADHLLVVATLRGGKTTAMQDRFSADTGDLVRWQIIYFKLQEADGTICMRQAVRMRTPGLASG